LIAKDHNYVSPQAEQFSKMLGITTEQLKFLDKITEDAPIASFFRIIMQQLLGWPMYRISNITVFAAVCTGSSQTNFSAILIQILSRLCSDLRRHIL
jgi:hypothetical protein